MELLNFELHFNITFGLKCSCGFELRWKWNYLQVHVKLIIIFSILIALAFLSSLSLSLVFYFHSYSLWFSSLSFLNLVDLKLWNYLLSFVRVTVFYSLVTFNNCLLMDLIFAKTWFQTSCISPLKLGRNFFGRHCHSHKDSWAAAYSSAWTLFPSECRFYPHRLECRRDLKIVT